MATVDKYLSQLTFNAVAGVAISEGELVGLSSAGTLWKADADATHSASATNRAVGVAVRGGASGATIAVAPIAVVSGLTGQTAGNIAYLDITAGSFVTDFGVVDVNTYTVQAVGIAVSTSSIWVNVGPAFAFQTAGNSTVNFR